MKFALCACPWSHFLPFLQVRSTWELLTSDFNPLELCSKLDPLLTSISALSSPMSAASPVKDLHMDQYTTPLKQVGWDTG